MVKSAYIRHDAIAMVEDKVVCEALLWDMANRAFPPYEL